MCALTERFSSIHGEKASYMELGWAVLPLAVNGVTNDVD